MRMQIEPIIDFKRGVQEGKKDCMAEPPRYRVDGMDTYNLAYLKGYLHGWMEGLEETRRR